MSNVVYVDLRESIYLEGESWTIEDIADIRCNDAKLSSQIYQISGKSLKSDALVVKMLDVVDLIMDQIEDIVIYSVGEQECVIRRMEKQKDNYIQYIKIGLICIILFFGAGFSIMSFNNDVSVELMFEKINFLVTKGNNVGMLLIEIFYSIGLGVGIIVFYNHFGSKKITKDPTPIEVEMVNYEQDVNNTIAQFAEKERDKK